MTQQEHLSINAVSSHFSLINIESATVSNSYYVSAQSPVKNLSTKKQVNLENIRVGNVMIPNLGSGIPANSVVQHQDGN